jgi:hypothetical protein
MTWIASAIDALEDIRASEVAAVSAELRRSVTRPAQIVPEIARLVSERRQRANRAASVADQPSGREWEINQEAQRRRAAARTRKDLSEVWEWERSARHAAGLSNRPRPAPLNRDELATLPAHVRTMGLNSGFLEYRDGKLCETT